MQAWCDNLAIDQATLKRKFNLAGIEWVAGDKVNALEVFRALTFENEKQAAATRKLEAEAEARERKNKKEAGLLMDIQGVEKTLWDELLQPLKQTLEQMPRLLAGQCNPQEPAVAEKILHGWVEETKNKLNFYEEKEI